MELSAVNLTKRYGSKTAVNRLNATLTLNSRVYVVTTPDNRRALATHIVG
ncbi:hypothetical protein [Schaedlerella sp.]